MIKLIAAVDQNLGIADEHGMPWKLKADLKYFRTKTMGGNVLMGYNTYKILDKPLERRKNFVLTSKSQILKPGFVKVNDFQEFLTDHQDCWIIGGANVFGQTLEFADKLYLTRIHKDFKCTKFFPKFDGKFKRKSVSKPQQEGDLTFHYEIWVKK